MDVRYRPYLQTEFVKFILDTNSFLFHLLILIPLLLTYSTMHQDSGNCCGVFQFCQDTNWLFQTRVWPSSYSHVFGGRGTSKPFYHCCMDSIQIFPNLSDRPQNPECLTVKMDTINIIQMPPLYFYLYQDWIVQAFLCPYKQNKVKLWIQSFKYFIGTSLSEWVIIKYCLDFGWRTQERRKLVILRLLWES